MNNEVKELLEKILEELSLISSSIKAEALNNFYMDFLSSDNRRKMYELFNGEKDAKIIAEIVGCTPRAVNIFIQELIEKDLVSYHKDGKAIIPEKSVSKIATYYSNKKLLKEIANE